jgi:hypothetical protein
MRIDKEFAIAYVAILLLIALLVKTAPIWVEMLNDLFLWMLGSWI